MKNRTLIGIICIVLAIVVTFLVSPLVNKMIKDTVPVTVASENIPQGGQINAENTKIIEINKAAVPASAIREQKSVIGAYAKSPVYAGDCITAEKTTKEANTADDVFSALNGNNVAVSFTIDSFAAGLSGKLQNGDIISLIVLNNETKKASIPPELKYVKVITTTTASGIDKDSVKEKEDGTVELPTTVTVLVTPEQARLIADYENNSVLQTALVYRGDKETAQKFLDTQTKYLGGGANE